jgi:hypothetical protein
MAAGERGSSGVHTRDLLYVAQVLRIKRHGLTLADFAKRAIVTAIVRNEINPQWGRNHADVLAWAKRHLSFNPDLETGKIEDEWEREPTEGEPLNATLELSLLESWMKDRNLLNT